MKVTCNFIILLLLLSSCGAGNRGIASQSQLGGAISITGSYGATEKNIALRICYSFRSKNTNFRASLVGSDFKYNLDQTSCDSINTKESISATLRAPFVSSSMILDSASSLAYYRNVETDQHGILKDTCNTLLRGGSPAKSSLNNGSLVEISFFSNINDSIIVRTASNIDGTYIVSTEERFQVTSALGNSIGRIDLITREKQCTNGKVESFSQQFIP